MQSVTYGNKYAYSISQLKSPKHVSVDLNFFFSRIIKKNSKIKLTMYLNFVSSQYYKRLIEPFCLHCFCQNLSRNYVTTTLKWFKKIYHQNPREIRKA